MRTARTVIRPFQLAPLVLLVAACAAPTAENKARAPAGTTVVILGDSRTGGYAPPQNLGFNAPVLDALLGFAAKQAPAAVFFTGDLSLGLEKEEADGEKKPEGNVPASGWWGQHGFVYDPEAFTAQLEAFKRIASARLGAIPFHPVIGNHDSVGPDSVERFKAIFPPAPGVQLAALDPAHLAYSVEVGDAVFFVLATDYYDAAGGGLKEHAISATQMEWLKQGLKKYRGRRLFVLGHEPAFSAGLWATGLDKNPAARDLFWRVLSEGGVTAYLCAHQHRFAKPSKHQGVWQVISGGAGASLDGSSDQQTDSPDAPTETCQSKGAMKDAFFHYLVLVLPSDRAAAPHLTVRDCQDRVRGEFDLK